VATGASLLLKATTGVAAAVQVTVYPLYSCVETLPNIEATFFVRTRGNYLS